MNKNNNDYVSIVYDENRAPKTFYPKQLISYLIKHLFNYLIN